MLNKKFLKNFYIKNIILINFNLNFFFIIFNNYFDLLFLNKFFIINNKKFINNYNYFFYLNKFLKYKDFLINLFINYFNYFFYLYFFSKLIFCRFLHIVSVGLGFRKKKKFKKKKKFLEFYIGNRHRLSYQLTKNFNILMLKRTSVIILSNSKNNIINLLKKFKSAKKEISFKIKGFFFNRVKISKIMART